MSADNGVYILKTRGREEGQFEYRVTHAQAIDNLNYNALTGKDQKDFIPEEAFAYFDGCEVFSQEEAAFAQAKQIAKDYPLLEYGICLLDFSHQEYPTHLTKDDYVRYQVEVDRAISRHRAEREAERQAWVAKNRIPVPAAGAFTLAAGGKAELTFRPSVMYGEMEQGDGIKVHGRVTAGPDGEWYFLPNR